jgi:large subunit ribosomal protein L2
MFSKLFYFRLRSGGRSSRVTFHRRGGGGRFRFPIYNFFNSFEPSLLIKRVYSFFNKGKSYDFLSTLKTEFSFRPSTRNVLPKSFLSIGPFSSIFPGNRLPLFFIPSGTRVHHLFPKVNGCYGLFSKTVFRSSIASSPGTSVVLLRRYSSNFTLVRIPSGEQRLIHSSCFATVGVSCDFDPTPKVSSHKSGFNRMLGFRPRSRGVSMNPVDHPHGGRTRRGNPPVSPFNVPARGFRTRRCSFPNYVFLSSKLKKLLI